MSINLKRPTDEQRRSSNETIMTDLSILSATALGLAALCVSPPQAPAQVQEYAWCSPRDGASWDCMYTTYQQCLAAASGQGGGCSPNPQYNLPRRSEAKAKH